MPVTHKFVSAKPDGSDASKVSSAKWNDSHAFTLGVTPMSTNQTLGIAHELILATAGAGGITLTLPTAVGITGTMYHIKRVDAAAGNVTIATTSAQTIDGDTSYILSNQWQYLKIVSDNANWVIVANN